MCGRFAFYSPAEATARLFGVDDAGNLDPIHVNDLGAYLVALTHYADLVKTAIKEKIDISLFIKNSAEEDEILALKAKISESVV
jgi:hypothetical protein